MCKVLHAGGSGFRLCDGSNLKLLILFLWLGHRGSTGVFPLLHSFSNAVGAQGSPVNGQLIVSVSRF